MKRFWDKVEKSENCWLWLASKNNNGYGIFSLNGRAIKASRMCWILINKTIPDGLHVLHTCDNRSCVNPAHLFLGTHMDNMRDKVAKNRQARTGNKFSIHKTHCPQGHQYSGINLKVYKGMRYCRICSSVYKKNYKLKIKTNGKNSGGI